MLSTSRIWKFEYIERKHDLCRGENCMEKFCESLKERPVKTFNFEKKKMIPLTKKQHDSYEQRKICKIAKTEFVHK